MTSSIYVPKNFYSLIRNTRTILNIHDREITYSDVKDLKDVIYNDIWFLNLSPSQIAKKYSIKSQSFHVFISKTLGLTLRSHSEAMKLLSKPESDPKTSYWKDCSFKFDVYTYPNIMGFELLSQYTFSSPQTRKPNSVYLHRDHMVSIAYGWENNISPSIISHPANCMILLESENCRKGQSCSISLESLIQRIKTWNSNPIIPTITQSKSQPKSKTHKENISKSSMGKKLYNDGSKCFWVKPGEQLLPSWKPGRLPFRH